MAWTIPWDLIGLIVSGDVGDYTIYTDRHGRKVVYPRQPPEVPRSPAQALQRNRFKTAQADWRALTADEKKALEDACKKLSMPMTGQNLWISAALRHDTESYHTVQTQSGITLPPLKTV